MTREEKIKNAINMYAPSVWDFGCGETISFSTDELNIASIAFTKGAEWADNNPKNSWISVEDDLPFNHKELLDSSKRMTFQVFIRYDDDRYGFSCMAKILDEWKWLNNWNKITHWMKVPEIPKEE